MARALATGDQCSLVLGLTGNAEVDAAALTAAESFASSPAGESHNARRKKRGA